MSVTKASQYQQENYLCILQLEASFLLQIYYNETVSLIANESRLDRFLEVQTRITIPLKSVDLHIKDYRTHPRVSWCYWRSHSVFFFFFFLVQTTVCWASEESSRNAQCFEAFAALNEWLFLQLLTSVLGKSEIL